LCDSACPQGRAPMEAQEGPSRAPQKATHALEWAGAPQGLCLTWGTTVEIPAYPQEMPMKMGVLAVELLSRK
jgi:hypothetical protein